MVVEIANKMFLGDCLDILPTFPNDCVDLLITDPPYFIPAKHYATRKNFRRNFSDLSMLEHFYKDFFREVERVVKNGGIIYIFCHGQSYPLFFYYLYFFTKSVRPLIWDKINSINGYSWRHQHEIIIFAEMPEAKPVPSGDGDIIKCRAVPANKRKHPAEKPVELIEKLLLKSSKEGDIVLDPFVGSGSVLKACKRNFRYFVGIELDEEYFKTAEEELKNCNKTTKRKKSVFSL